MQLLLKVKTILCWYIWFQKVYLLIIIIETCGSKVLVTAGSWREHSNVDKWGDRNYYKDTCLRKAGGEQVSLKLKSISSVSCTYIF